MEHGETRRYHFYVRICTINKKITLHFWAFLAEVGQWNRMLVNVHQNGRVRCNSLIIIVQFVMMCYVIQFNSKRNVYVAKKYHVQPKALIPVLTLSTNANSVS